jgi:subtilisin family serine protease
MKRAPLAVLGLLLVALSLPSLPSGKPAAPTYAETAIDGVPQALREKVRREGLVRVIVELQLPGTVHVPEGFLSGRAAVVAQRNEIAVTRAHLLRRLRASQHRVVHVYKTVPLIALEVTPAALAELEASSFFVRRVVEDTLAEPMLMQSGPLVEAPLASARGLDGTGQVVAILDTGVDSTHPFLAGKVVEEACYSSNTPNSFSLCRDGATELEEPGAAAPCSGVANCDHGTHVAGIAAGSGAGFSGIARGAQIMAVQVFSRFTNPTNCGGSPPCLLSFTSDQIKGLERVLEVFNDQVQPRPIASVNMSLGGSLFSGFCDSQPQRFAIENLRSVGIATVIASGNNSSRNQMSAPACISAAVSVGSTTKSDQVSSFSNISALTSLLAPGTSINSSVPDGGFLFKSGTSMATPHVAGAWAVLKQAAPAATVTQILTALQQTGLPVTDTRPGGSITKPRIRIDQAVATFAAAAEPTLTVDTTTAEPGAQVTVTLTNGLGGALDWLAFAATTDPDTSYLDWTYVGDGVTSRSWTVNMPLAPGSYHFRLFLDNGYTRVATSATVTVGGTPPVLTVDKTMARVGELVTVTLTNGLGGEADWLTIALTTDPDTTYLEWTYVGSGVTEGTWTINMPAPPGDYHFRLFLNNGYTRAATSPTVTVTP